MTRRTELDQLIHGLIDRGQLADAQYAIGMDGAVVATKAFGQATLDSRFCIFSATKPVFASLIWRLIDEGLISLETRVADVWNEFGQYGKEAITLEQLLLFTAGIPSPMISRDAVGSRKARVHEIEQWQVEFTPGSKYSYHAFSAGWILAEVVTRLTGRPHGDALRTLVLDPLSIGRLDLGASSGRALDIRPVDYVGDSPFDIFEALSGRPAPSPDTGTTTPFDIRAFANDPDVIDAGAPGGGAISDAASVALFYQALLHNPGGLWSPPTLAGGTSRIRNTFPDPLRLGAPANRSLGLVIAGTDNPQLTLPEHGVELTLHPFGPAVSSTTFGHGGVGGQIAFADPATGLSFCFLSNVIDRDVTGAMQTQQDIVAAAWASTRS